MSFQHRKLKITSFPEMKPWSSSPSSHTVHKQSCAQLQPINTGFTRVTSTRAEANMTPVLAPLFLSLVTIFRLVFQMCYLLELR